MKICHGKVLLILASASLEMRHPTTYIKIWHASYTIFTLSHSLSKPKSHNRVQGFDDRISLRFDSLSLERHLGMSVETLQIIISCHYLSPPTPSSDRNPTNAKSRLYDTRRIPKIKANRRFPHTSSRASTICVVIRPLSCWPSSQILIICMVIISSLTNNLRATKCRHIIPSYQLDLYGRVAIDPLSPVFILLNKNVFPNQEIYLTFLALESDGKHL
ncbi:uncharacterized protein F4822DRAFT_270009 [Hypoxylon trugodes]|uniref:uncharacterized protein n=1 Tax=Hypoxylon trugodes TaxID=326681 RepID=UPI002198B873|nr:uncharacterized protein F4822DRAFT_270009 [Hypoxylon trugodes]KAI1389113.1 hypothetical protein F4822DRAFT_270009 [Hypoxylon trugodes]